MIRRASTGHATAETFAGAEEKAAHTTPRTKWMVSVNVLGPGLSQYLAAQLLHCASAEELFWKASTGYVLR